MEVGGQTGEQWNDSGETGEYGDDYQLGSNAEADKAMIKMKEIIGADGSGKLSLLSRKYHA